MRILHRHIACFCAALTLSLFGQYFQETAASPLPAKKKSESSKKARLASAAREPSVVEWVQSLLLDEGKRSRMLWAVRTGRLAQLGEASHFFQRFPRHRRMLEGILSSPEGGEKSPATQSKAAGAAILQNDALKVIAAQPEGPPHGMAFYGNTAIVGAGAALLFFNLSGSEPAKVGMQRVPYTIRDLAVDGDRLYVIGGRKLQVFDLLALGKRSQPLALLKELGSSKLDIEPLQIEVSGNRSYLTTTNGVHIYNASNPQAINKEGHAAAPFAFTTVIDPSANRMYVGTWNGMKIFDITDPAVPNELGNYTAPSSVGSFFAMGDRAFVGLSDKIEILDVADPANIQTVGSIPQWGADISGFQCGNNTTVLVSSRWSISSFSPSDWSQPQMTYFPTTGIDRLVLDENPCSSPTRIGGYGREGVEIGSFDGVTLVAMGGYNTLSPIVQTITDPMNPPFTAYGVGSWEVRQVDWSADPTQPIIQTTTFGNVGKENGFFGGAAVWQQGERRIGAFGLNSAAGVTVQDMTDFSNPYEIARTQAGGFTNVIKECGNLMILGTDEGQIVIFDKSDPQNLVELSRTNVPNGSIREIEIRCPDRLYVAAGDGGFLIMDITDPKNPKTLSQTAGSVWDVGVTGNYACIHDFKAGGIRVLDISDPAHPQQTDFLSADDVEGGILDMTAEGGYLHVSNRIENYDAYKIENGKIKGPVAQQELPGAKSIEVKPKPQGPMKSAGGPVYYIYTGNGDGGMYILEFNPAAANSAPEFVAALPDTAVKQGETLEYDFDAIDADGDTVEFVPVSLPAGATLDTATGLFRWAVTTQVPTGDYTVTVGASDGKDTTATSATVTVVSPTGVAGRGLPASFEIHSVYPNPFVDRLTVRYSSPGQGSLRVIVYDLLGREVRSLDPRTVRRGAQQVLRLNLQSLPAGMYFVRLEATVRSHTSGFTKKLVRLR